jgi:hypothetical protein
MKMNLTELLQEVERGWHEYRAECHYSSEDSDAHGEYIFMVLDEWGLTLREKLAVLDDYCYDRHEYFPDLQLLKGGVK